METAPAQECEKCLTFYPLIQEVQINANKTGLFDIFDYIIVILRLMEKTYARDKRSPVPKNESTSKVMSANKARNTKPEIILRKILWAADYRGYRLNYKNAPGKPDIAFPRYKIAIFINGCFWHRCPNCNLPLPKSNAEFWVKKFEKNKERDLKKITLLQENGWRTFVIWECEIQDNILIGKLKEFINEHRY